jgi:methylmalonyl-CoA mutase N-terminal domain/subunit
VRGAVQTVALGLAGVSALEISTFDEGYRTPSKEAHLVGLRTQQVIDLETNINSVQDPFGGSWFMESLTDEVEARILDMVNDIEARGDPAELVSSGYFKQFFHGTMGRYHHQVRDGEVLKVGMNVHQMPAEQDTLLRDISEEKIEPLFDRVKEIAAYRNKRDQKPLLDSFQRLHDVVQTDENMLEAVLECTLAGATMGEIAGILRQAWGTPYDPYGHLESPIGSAQ